MKVVDRKAFLMLPAGTIYCKGKQWFFEGINIKGDSIDNGMSGDWWTLNMAWADAPNSNEAFDLLEASLATGSSFPHQDGESRDGLFADDAIFLVFERADLLTLRGYVDAALALPVVIDGELTKREIAP